MISLENVSQTILALQSMDVDVDTLLQKTKEFFFLLFQEDSFFIIAADESVSDDALHNKSFLPCIAAITPERESQYLRLFSHKNAAMQYLSELKLPERNCVPVSSLETVQLAKFWFLRGVRGYVLNDGFPWAAVSFPDYLQMVFQNLLEAPEMYQQKYVDFILAQPPLSDENLDFHSVQYVNLDFEPDNKPAEQYALLPVQAKPEGRKPKWNFKDYIQNIKPFWKREKKQSKREPKTAHKISYKKLLLPIGLGIAFCVPLSIAGISVIRTANFSAALENHDFAKAIAIYEQNAGSGYFIKTADGKITENIEQLIMDYAGGRIDIEDVRKQLKSYQQFSDPQDEFSVYTNRVSQLESSKSAYLSGLARFEQGNYLQGLSDWTLVVPDDCCYQNVMNSISQNEKVYKAQGLLQCENYKAAGQDEKYQKGMELLYRWFPHDGSLIQQGSDLQTPVFVDEDYPIMIEDISVSMPNPNMGRDLHIQWTNTSGKTISSITFLTEAVDAFGNPAKCSRGGYSLYQAAADGPFANGEGMEENSYWQSAWYNSVIENANLLSISICYTDGSSEEISDPAVLEALKK